MISVDSFCVKPSSPIFSIPASFVIVLLLMSKAISLAF